MDSTVINCLVIGAPRSGKSTLCNLLINGRNFVDKSTGQPHFPLSPGPQISSCEHSIPTVVRNNIRVFESMGLYPSSDEFGMTDAAWAMECALQASLIAHHCGGIDLVLFCVDNRFHTRSAIAWKCLLRAFEEERLQNRLLLVFTRTPAKVLQMSETEKISHFLSTSNMDSNRRLGEMLEKASNNFVCIDVEEELEPKLKPNYVEPKRGFMYREVVKCILRLKQMSPSKIKPQQRIISAYDTFRHDFMKITANMLKAADDMERHDIFENFQRSKEHFFLKEIGSCLLDAIPELKTSTVVDVENLMRTLEKGDLPDFFSNRVLARLSLLSVPIKLIEDAEMQKDDFDSWGQ